MDNLDREIAQLRRRLEHLEGLRERRDERLYQSDRWDRPHYDDRSYHSQEVSYFPLILMGLIFALLLV